MATLVVRPMPYPIARGQGCPPCPPCAVPFAGTPPAPGRPFFAPLDEASPGGRGQGRGWGRVSKSLLPGFPPFLPEDLVPGDEFMAFSGLGAGPDPSGMSCPAIISGYEKNALMATTRRADHAANARARVAELEPYYAKCGGGKMAPSVTPDQPVEVPGFPSMPGYPGLPENALVDRGRGGGGGGQGQRQPPGMFDNIDMKQVGIVAGAAVGLLVLVAVLKKKKSKPMAAATTGSQPQDY